ncbi:hypothetical protein CYLTODRAFT_423774 [Cylindrobasidium torrendii FP15055 ss-10]|uniref:Uncharacterized protein n=1 Tax=Cylindrobasidium torrendii FP15055 ss-10 TaxID=1314674 RepID=A0A0D7B785_9AGAR|nr:hypothetical protein CYLTODRAFT_423774 [Cylindrobasidium torrendii FP15055 ss-10]
MVLVHAEPFTLVGIRQLEINECALHAIHAIISLPNLTHLALSDLPPEHTSHTPLLCQGLIDSPSEIYFGHALHLLNASKAHIRTLRIDAHHPHTEQFFELLRFVQGDLTTLRFGGGRDARPVFALMEDKSTPLLPKLQWLEICECNLEDILFQESPFLEQLILTRLGPAPEMNIPPLKSLSLDSSHKAASPSSFRRICAESSLAQTLLRCRNEGLQVQWTHTDGDIDDILERATKVGLTRF